MDDHVMFISTYFEQNSDQGSVLDMRFLSFYQFLSVSISFYCPGMALPIFFKLKRWALA